MQISVIYGIIIYSVLRHEMESLLLFVKLMFTIKN